MVGEINILLDFSDGLFHGMCGVGAVEYSKENYELDLTWNYLEDLEVQK